MMMMMTPKYLETLKSDAQSWYWLRKIEAELEAWANDAQRAGEHHLAADLRAGAAQARQQANQCEARLYKAYLQLKR